VSRQFHAAGLPAALGTELLVWVLGLAAVFSFNLWKNFTPLDFIPQLAGRTVFSILDYVVSNFILPFNAMLLALLAGWAIDARRMREDIGIVSGTSWLIWCTSIRFLATVAVFSVFLFNLAT
jgi:NSS family neurotransmitter:Na+ symporter